MTPHPAAADQTAVEVDSLDFCYGSKQSLFHVTMKVPRNRVTAFIGPSGCGKSTLLRCINRMNDRIPEARVTGGSIRIDGVDVTSPSLDPIHLRREVGMVFQKSNPFPMTIYENVSYGLKLAGVRNRGILDEAVEESLRHAALWDEVKDRLHASANGLSGGQQQRLCIARSIAVKPRILLMDEPCSALDPIATVRVEELMHRLKEEFTIIVVTHNMQQATRVSDLTGFSCWEGWWSLIPRRRFFQSFHERNGGLYHGKIQLTESCLWFFKVYFQKGSRAFFPFLRRCTEAGRILRQKEQPAPPAHFLPCRQKRRQSSSQYS